MLSTATKAAAGVTKVLAENDVRRTARQIEDEGRDVLDNVADYASEAGQKVRGVVDRTLDRTQRVTHDLEAEIKANPIRSSVIALGAGFILGALLTRR